MNNESPPPTDGVHENNIHIRITETGEICAWGLNAEGEKLLFRLTGNFVMVNKFEHMSFNLCG
ncbi:MAG: hypothetical protein JXR89_04245 [Deltaproteobacteria bacterium]|nr:hypothetical protein [Deltaproteobacteria bacterium]